MKITNILTGDSWGDVGPEALERGVGGREGALLYLSKEWAEAGHQVTSFVPAQKSSRFETSKGGFHEYIPLSLTRTTLENWKHDVAIAWECPSVFEYERIREQTPLRITYLQCSDFPSDKDMEHAEKYCHLVATLSEWHKGYILHRGLLKQEDEVVILPNGIKLSRYPRTEKRLNRPWRFIYSSSPDRGLWYLLQAWPHIRKYEPEAELIVTYGVKNWTSKLKWSHNRQGEMAVEIEKLMAQNGVADFGKIGQSQLAKLQLSATAWPYPLDAASATETGCISCLENMAAGNPVITTDCDCMDDEYGDHALICQLPIDPKDFAEAINFVLTDETVYNDYQERGYDFVSDRDWSDISKKWIELFQKHLN